MHAVHGWIHACSSWMDSGPFVNRWMDGSAGLGLRVRQNPNEMEMMGQQHANMAFSILTFEPEVGTKVSFQVLRKRAQMTV